MTHLNRVLCLSAIFCLSIAGFATYIFHLWTGFIPQPILIRPFELFPVYWYGVIVLVAVSIGFWVGTAYSPANDYQSGSSIWRYAISIVISSIVGARLFDVIFLSPIARSQGITNGWDYLENPVLLFDLNWGGLNIWGALFGGSMMLFWYCWRANKLRIPVFFKAVIGLLIGLSLAQWGHFVNQELYGWPWEGFGSIFIEPVHRLAIYSDSNRFVPLFLFAAIWYLVGGLLLFFGRRWTYSPDHQFDGIMVGLIWFLVGRIVIELATPNSLFNWLPASLLLIIIFVTALSRRSAYS